MRCKASPSPNGRKRQFDRSPSVRDAARRANIILGLTTLMANTPPKRPIQERADKDLVEDLCIELRHVACADYELPHGHGVIAHIREVCGIHAELAIRRVDSVPRLVELSEETRWQIPTLLGDCLAFPERLPYVREADGIRRTLRCHLCSKAERPQDAKLLWFCNGCLRCVLDGVRQRSPLQGIVLFRTYSAECRCSHADADTVLATDHCSDVLFGVCERCICDELERRRLMP
jgi:hypothetical protein